MGRDAKGRGGIEYADTDRIWIEKTCNPVRKKRRRAGAQQQKTMHKENRVWRMNLEKGQNGLTVTEALH